MRKSMVPFGGDWLPTRGDDMFATFRREMDRVFDDVLGGRTALGAWRRGDVMPSLDVEESDEAVKVTVELPGVDEKDVELTLDRDILTVKGEKKAEKTVDEAGRHVVERSFGQFSRTVRLPTAVEADKVEARFDKGILTVTLPKPAEARAEHRRIEIKKAH